MKLLGRRRLRDLGPLDWFALAVAVLGVGMGAVALFGWRPSFEASRTGRPERPAKQMLLISLSVTCGMLSLLLGPR